MSDADGLPQNLEAERSVLGSILLDPAALPLVVLILREDDFFPDTHRRIYRAMLELSRRSAAIDVLTLREEFSQNGGVEKAGGAAYLSSLTDGVPELANVEHYARIVKEKSARRRLIETGRRLVRDGLTSDQPTSELIAAATRDVSSLAKAHGPEAAAGGSPFRSLTLPELAAMPIPLREMIVAPFLGKQETAFVYGPKGNGKTWIGLGSAMLAAQGGGATFLTFKAPSPGVAVLYVDGEMMARDIRQRASDLCRTASLDPGDRLFIWTPDAQPDGAPHLDLFSEAGRALFEQHIEELEQKAGIPIELVCLDNLRTLFPGWEENKAESFLPVAAWTIQLRARRRSVALFHHANKEGGYSGNTAIVSTVHAILRVEHPKDYHADMGAAFDVTYEYTRAKPADLENFNARLEGDAWTVEAAAHVADELIRILTAQGLSIRAIADQVGKGKNAVAAAQKRLGITRAES